MRFLIDENVIPVVVSLLRKEGYDVKDIKEEKLYGLKDSELFRIAIKEKRTVITHDKDFTNIVLKESLPARKTPLCGLFRSPTVTLLN